AFLQELHHAAKLLAQRRMAGRVNGSDVVQGMQRTMDPGFFEKLLHMLAELLSGVRFGSGPEGKDHRLGKEVAELSRTTAEMHVRETRTGTLLQFLPNTFEAFLLGTRKAKEIADDHQISSKLGKRVRGGAGRQQTAAI